MPKATPLVFISSTKEDLNRYRSAAKEAAIQAGFLPVMMDYFAAQSEEPPYPACMAKVDPCDVLVVIVAHRYGWVPQDQPEPGGKSITWLECRHANEKKRKAEVLAFLVDEKRDWPPQLREAYRSTKAIEEGTDTPELVAEVKRNVAKLKEFKQWLGSLGTRSSFFGPEDLKAKVLAALYEWRDRHAEFRAAPAAAKREPAKYLQWLREQTAWIDIRGLQVGTGKAHRFPIDELYIPLKTMEGSSGGEAGKELRKPVRLERALRHQRLVIVGDPGSGKTTFLRRIGYELCRGTGKPGLKLTPQGFPILIRIAELEEYIADCRRRHEAGTPTTKESPAWLVHFLERRSKELRWNLDADFFERRLGEKSTLVLLDGLDEPPSQAERESMARLFEGATQTYGDCQFVVTTRPGSYQGRATLEGFQQVQIDDLETEAVERFLLRWSQSLYPDNPSEAEEHCRQLLEALHARVEIRRMARNPVMLTALAVVHWNEKRLPEQRADLYESVVIWLARSREQRPGREPAERCLALLGHLALEMQNQPQGRVTQVSKGPAAEMIAPGFREIAQEERFHRAQSFLDEEEVDSGIVVSRGSELRFWHLTFQEYLAARAVSGLAEAAQQKLLLSDGKLYRPEWREVMLLLAGILLVKQGPEKVDGLFQAVLERVDAKASLADKARCAGLLGAMLGDLRPLAYQPPAARYEAVLRSVLDVFDAGKSGAIDLLVRLEAAEALGQAGDPRLREENWVTIPAGTFLMGAQNWDRAQPNYDAEAMPDESPVHEVRLGAYQMGRYPVTVEEYRRFMEDDGYQNEQWWKDGGFGHQSQPVGWEGQLLHPNWPVSGVTWYEAAAWCAWAGGRLPTEAEWERAARGGESRKYPWGNEPPDRERTNCEETNIHRPTPVGLLPRGMTPEGLHDMAGNVLEWVADWYAQEYYTKSAPEIPQGPDEGKYRVLRGGSWIHGSEYLRSADRYWFAPEDRYDFIGLRCAREVVP